MIRSHKVANPEGGRYAMCLQEIRLLTRADTAFDSPEKAKK